MPEFVLDTSGEVRTRFDMAKQWHQLDAFTRGYIEALFFTETEGLSDTAQLRHEEGDAPEPFQFSIGFADLAPGALDSIIADCAAFQAGAAYKAVREAEDNEELGDLFEGHGGVSSMAGHDFWLTRNGHGAGFWDGDWPEPYATALTDAAKAFGECSPYVGDDGKVYV